MTVRSITLAELNRGVLAGLVGKRCCRQQSGEWRSLSIGFGEKVYHGDPKIRATPYYGEWELRTYGAAWRVTRGNRVLCGSREVVDVEREVDERLQLVKLGGFQRLDAVSIFDLRVQLDDGTSIDFMEMSTDDGHLFDIRAPNDVSIKYSTRRGWMIGPSNVAWDESGVRERTTGH